MRITLRQVEIRELVDGFSSSEEEGVRGYGGRLNIRPAFQREFVYNERQQQEVIQSIFKQFPLNVMYWLKGEADTYELLDGQQRTLSICSYHQGEYVIEKQGTLKFFHTLTPEEREQFLSYPLQVYVCEDSTTQEQLDWFRIINIAGEKLTDQELLNAVYSGPWITSCKRRFSKPNCVAKGLGEKLMSGTPIRQDYLRTVLLWISARDGINLDLYMARHQHDENSDREWQYYQQVINWAKMLFTTTRREMKQVQWGLLYNLYHDRDFSSTALEQEVARLMMDDDVTNKKGIYDYVLSHRESALSIRAFTPAMRASAYERQQGICPKCGRHYELSEMQADHIVPWSKGGHTVKENCQMLCQHCNATKSDN
ncbi:MAG: DUF262 domain-containing protein [Prevotellaceae bacterium]|nr:DUF262 domain-containing protein [Prevotellaceae bacterium]